MARTGTAYGTKYKSVETNKILSVIPSVGVSLGMMYKINASFLIYAEVTPNVYYQYENRQVSVIGDNNVTEEQTTSIGNNRVGFSDISNSGAMLTFVYRITGQ